MVQHDRDNLRQLSENTSSQAARRLEIYFDTRFQLLEQLENEWETIGAMDREAFADRTHYLHQEFKGFLAINWIDPQGVIRWVTPELPNRKALGLDLHVHKDERVREAIAEAQRTQNPSYTPPILLAQGGIGITSYMPLVRDGQLEGFLNGVFRIPPLIEASLKEEIGKQFAYRVSQGDLEIYRSGNVPEEAKAYTTSRNFMVGDNIWRLDINPKLDQLQSMGRSRFLLIVVGVVMSLLLAVGIHLIFRHHIKLSRSEIRYSTLFANANDAIILIDDFAVVDCNPKTYEMFRCGPQDLPRLAYNLFEHNLGGGESSAVTVRKNSEAALDGQDHFFEGSFQRLDGTKFFAEIFLTSLVVDDRRMIQMIIRDISDRKRTEHQLMESEEKYRLLVDNAADAIFISRNGAIEFFNPKANHLAACDKETMRRLRFSDLIHPDDRIQVMDFMDDVENRATPIQARFSNAKEETIWVLISAVPIIWRGLEASLIFARDITDQKEMESRLLHSQKMESVGTLAGGIAHDFNNLLMGMQGYISLLLVDPDTPFAMREKLQSVEQQIQSGAGLTRQLLGFARGGKYDVQPTNMVELVNKSADLFARTHKEMRIHRDFRDQDVRAEVDRTQLEQVLLNMYLNAWQATKNHGEIYLTVRHVELSNEFLKAFNLKEINYLMIRVRDTGEGMNRETLQRVFEPFFSRRERGRGTGLGMASAYGIIKNHGGVITVDSSPGNGAIFDVYLPTTEKALKEEPERKRDLTTGTGRILMIDDESMILDVGKAMLTKLGYRVTAIQNCREALSWFNENRDSVDLVVLDMVMPDMNGSEMFTELKQLDASVNVLLSSGYSLNEDAKALLAAGARGFIQKPYNLAGLSSKIREVMVQNVERV